MWPWRHLWVEFVVGSLLCSERFFSEYSPSPQKPTFPNSESILECMDILNEFLSLLGALWVNKLHLHFFGSDGKPTIHKTTAYPEEYLLTTYKEKWGTERKAPSSDLGICQFHLSYFRVAGDSGSAFPFTSVWFQFFRWSRNLERAIHREIRFLDRRAFYGYITEGLQRVGFSGLIT